MNNPIKTTIFQTALVVGAAWVLAVDPLIAQDAPTQQNALQNKDNFRIAQLELKDALVVHAARLIAEMSGLNVVPTESASKKRTTLYLQNVTAKEAIITMCKASNLWYRQDAGSNTYRVMTTQEYQKDLFVFRKDLIQFFTVLHPNAVTVAQAIEDLFNERVILSMGLDSDDPLFEEQLLNSGFGGGLGGAGGFGTGGIEADDGGFQSSSQSSNSFRRGQSYNRSGSGRVRTSIRSGSGGQGVPRQDRVLDQPLTVDQIATLEQRFADAVSQKTESSSVLSGLSQIEPPIYVAVVRQHNVLIVRTSDADAMKQIESLVKELDRPTPQVLLEMKILELTLGDTFKSIFDVQVTTGRSTSGPEDSQPANPLALANVTSPRNVLGLGNFPVEPGASFVYQFLSNDIRTRLELLAQEDRIEILATPMILASNNRPAAIFIGEEAVLTRDIDTTVITSEFGATSLLDVSTETRQVGTTLVFQPKINADNTVTLTIAQDSSSIKPQGATLPVFDEDGSASAFAIDTVDTRQVQGIIIAKDNLTIAVGGLIRTRISDVEQKVPVLGDLPLLDLVFKKKNKEKVKTELILLITPHILRSGEQGQQVTQQRMRALSDHQYLEQGDEALQEHFKHMLEKNKANQKKRDGVTN